MTKRKKTPGSPDQMQLSRAARAAIESQGDRKDLKMAAFLSIFHPNMAKRLQRKLIKDAGCGGIRA